MTARVRNTEYMLPLVVGTVAFSLGKKATDSSSHRWTVYVRHANGLDLSQLVKKVVYQLHPSFATPIREVTAAPFFELTEHGWGEFEIAAKLHFSDDAAETPVELYHKLRLYTESETTNQNAKKPVVAETYDELVFYEPTEAFHGRVSPLSATPMPSTPLSQHFPSNPRAAALQELNTLTEARQKNAQILANLQAQLDRYG